jgi:hypothetical protein
MKCSLHYIRIKHQGTDHVFNFKVNISSSLNTLDA